MLGIVGSMEMNLMWVMFSRSSWSNMKVKNLGVMMMMILMAIKKKIKEMGKKLNCQIGKD